jgi:F0F1-type ATP synthase assembly protein I
MIKIDTRKLRVAIMMGNAVMTKAIMIALAWYLGSKLDKKLGTEPYLMILLVVLAMVFGVWYILYIAKKNNLTD